MQYLRCSVNPVLARHSCCGSPQSALELPIAYGVSSSNVPAVDRIEWTRILSLKIPRSSSFLLKKLRIRSRGNRNSASRRAIRLSCARALPQRTMHGAHTFQFSQPSCSVATHPNSRRDPRASCRHDPDRPSNSRRCGARCLKFLRGARRYRI